MTEKREIKSHKGGRTGRLEVRLEPDVAQYLKERGAADWITRKVREEQEGKDAVIERLLKENRRLKSDIKLAFNGYVNLENERTSSNE